MKPGPGPGTYALLLGVEDGREVEVGALGRFRLEPGCYVYAGSALGPGGLGARLAHHATPLRTVHWHVDHLRPHADLLEAWIVRDRKRREHLWASVLSDLPGAEAPVPDFGASDCRCPTHLLRFVEPPDRTRFHRDLHRHAPDHPVVHRARPDELRS